jgi:integrase
VWEVRVFVGRDQQGNPRQVSRTVRGTKREAQRVAAALTVAPPSRQSHTVAEALDAWLETNRATWAASTVRDQTSRVALVKRDPIARIEVGRLTVADVDRWHARVRANGVGEASLRNQHLVLRAGLTQAARWDWVSNNVVASATLGRRKTQPRAALSSTEVRDALDAAERIDTAVGLALRLAAVTGARRAELCALRWTDLVGSA